MSITQCADPNVPIPLPFSEHCMCPSALSEQRISVVSIVCRICYDTEKEEPLITPCRCKGTVAFVHRSCLEKWLGESNTTTCELCHQIFKTERTPKYTSGKSIWKWLRHSRGQRAARSVKSDLLACTLLTPIAILITYVCLFSSDYYNQKKFATIPAARWTSMSLLFMIAIMLIGYYLWVYSVIRLHARMWYNWWQRECTVKYIPPSNINITNEAPGHIHTPNNTPLSGAASTTNEGQDGIVNRPSTFRVECEETEIYHELLDKVDEMKQKKSAFSSDYEIGETSEVGEPDRKVIDKPSISIIKNKGIVYILNITEPPGMEGSNTQAMFSKTCLDAPSNSSEDDDSDLELNLDDERNLEDRDSTKLEKKKSSLGQPSFASAVSSMHHKSDKDVMEMKGSSSSKANLPRTLSNKSGNSDSERKLVASTILESLTSTHGKESENDLNRGVEKTSFGRLNIQRAFLNETDSSERGKNILDSDKNAMEKQSENSMEVELKKSRHITSTFSNESVKHEIKKIVDSANSSITKCSFVSTKSKPSESDIVSGIQRSNSGKVSKASKSEVEEIFDPTKHDVEANIISGFKKKNNESKSEADNFDAAKSSFVRASIARTQIMQAENELQATKKGSVDETKFKPTFSSADFKVENENKAENKRSESEIKRITSGRSIGSSFSARPSHRQSDKSLDFKISTSRKASIGSAFSTISAPSVNEKRLHYTKSGFERPSSSFLNDENRLENEQKLHPKKSSIVSFSSTRSGPSESASKVVPKRSSCVKPIDAPLTDVNVDEVRIDPKESNDGKRKKPKASTRQEAALETERLSVEYEVIDLSSLSDDEAYF